MRRMICLTAMLGLYCLGGCNSATEPPQPPAATTPKTTTTNPAAQAPPAEAAEKAAPGIAVGERAPDFHLLDQTGAERTLSGLLEQSNVALVFFRSTDW